MNVLFVHQNFPAQYKNLAPHLVKQGHRVVALGLRSQKIPGMDIFTYPIVRQPSLPVDTIARELEVKIARGESVAAMGYKLTQNGFTPDLIFVHPGWGEGLFLREVWPNAKIVVYCEYYYNREGQDYDFDPEFTPTDFVSHSKLRLKNTPGLLAFETADALVAPTPWQRSLFPDWMQCRIEVIHEGIDFERVASRHSATLGRVGSRYGIPEEAPVVTYISRSLEPLRGFHVFMRALPEVLKRVPDVRVVIVGQIAESYGKTVSGSRNWRERMLEELGDSIDISRVFFTGQLSYEDYLAVLQGTSAHVYLSYPFVLSWSFLEAIASGAPLITSDTGATRDFTMGNQRRVDFFDIEGIADAIVAQLEDGRSNTVKAEQGREALREIVDVEYCLNKYDALITRLFE